MQYLTLSFRATVEEESKLFEEHCCHCPDRSLTTRRKLFWRKHPGKDRLIEDTKSGKAKHMKPKDLWASHKDYQKFSLGDFRAHIYREKYKQIAGPYWQKKRNKYAMKQHEEAVDKMYHEWNNSKLEEDMNDMISQFEAI